MSAPLGTPESPELRNDPSKAAQIINASCLREYKDDAPRCTVTLQFANTGGPWSKVTLVWTLRYDNGNVIQGTWSKEGRIPDNIITVSHTHFRNGAVVEMGDSSIVGMRDKNGRQMTIVNAAVETTSIER